MKSPIPGVVGGIVTFLSRAIALVALASGLRLAAQVDPTGQAYTDYGTYANGGGYQLSYVEYINHGSNPVDLRIAVSLVAGGGTNYYEYMYDIQPGATFWLQVEGGWTYDPYGLDHYYEARSIDAVYTQVTTESCGDWSYTTTWGDKSYGPTNWNPKVYGAPNWGPKSYGATDWNGAKIYGTTVWDLWSYTDVWGPWSASTSRAYTSFTSWQPDASLYPPTQLVHQTRTAYFTDTTTTSRTGTRNGTRTGTIPWTQSGTTPYTQSGTVAWTQDGTIPWTRTGTRTGVRICTVTRSYAETGAVLGTTQRTDTSTDTVTDSGSDPTSTSGTDSVSQSGSDSTSRSGSDPTSDSSTEPISESNTTTSNGAETQSQDVSGTGSSTVTFNIPNLTVTYTGSPQSATVTPSDPAASYTVSYFGTSGTTYGPTSAAPTNAGTYTVTATATGGYTGSGSGTLTINKANQAITLNALTVQTYGTSQTLSTIGGSGTGAVTYAIIGQSATGVASLSGATLTATSGTGWVDVQATKAADTNYNAATSPTVRVTLQKASQTITFVPIGTRTYGDAPFAAGASATSGLPVTIAVISGPATVSNGTITLTGTGSVSVRASQAGDSNYNAASSVDQPFMVVARPISVTLAGSKPYDSTTTATGATASITSGSLGTGDTISYAFAATSSANVGTYSGLTTATIRSSSNSDVSGYYAISYAGVYSIVKANQTIAFDPLANRALSDSPFNLSGTASSGLPVTFVVLSGPATMSGNSVTLTGTGTVTIRATQAGNGNYNAATAVDQSFTVTTATATITLDTASLNQSYSGSAKFATGSTNPVGLSFLITYNGGTTAPIAAGNYTVTATITDPNYQGSTTGTMTIAPRPITLTLQGSKVYDGTTTPTGAMAPITSGLLIGGDTLNLALANTSSASPGTYTGLATATITSGSLGNVTASYAITYTGSYTITKAPQTIAFVPVSNKTYGDAAFTVSASASSGLPVTVSVLSGPASVTGNTVTITGAGTVTLRASQAGDTNYAAATNVDQTFTVSKASQTITFTAISGKVYGDPAFNVTATASSGLPVTLSIVSGPATIAGNTITLTGAGSVTVRASQAGDSNYNAASSIDQTFTISVRPLTVTLGGSKAYDGTTAATNATASITTGSLAAGDTISYAIAATSSADPGQYTNLVTATVKNAGGANVTSGYNIGYLGSYTITKADQTIALPPLPDVTYGVPPFLIIATSTSGLPVTLSVVSGPATISGTTVTVTGTGTVTIRGTQAGNADYNAAPSVDRSFNVAKRRADVSLTNLNQLYDGTPKSATAVTVPAGLSVDCIYSPSVPILAGAYTVTATINDPNYYGNAIGTLAIAPRPITITLSGSKPYDGTTMANGASAAITSGTLAAGDTITFSFAGTSSANAGRYTGIADPMIRNSSGAMVVPSYQITSAGNYTILKADQSIAFAPLANQTYGDAPFAISATASSGMAVSFSVVSGPATLSGNTVTLSGAGSVTIRASQAGDSNYNAAANVDRTFTVAKASQSITFPAIAPKTYGDAPFAVNATASSGLPVTLSVVSGPATLSGNTVTLTGAGTVTLRASQSGDANYNAASSVDQSFTVGKATATIALGNLNPTYDGMPKAATATANPSSVTVTITYDGSSAAPTNAGSYAVVATINDANYQGSASGTLTVAKAPLTAAADDKTKVYGAANPPLTISYNGFVNGETIASITPPTASTTAAATSPAGAYPIKLTGGSAANYTLTLVDGALTITKASLTVTANDQARTYGAVNPTLSYTITGFINGDTSVVVSGAASVTTPATVTSPVGTYAIVPTLGSLSAANYTFGPFVNGTLTVTRALLTVTANDKTKVYGDANPTFDATITGFVNGETASIVSGTPTFTTSATATSGAGTYAIVPALGTLTASNYAFATFNPGTLTVTKAMLTVKADDKTRVYGTANPAFTFTYSGFVNGDTASAVSTLPTLSTSATAGSSVGSYAIVPSGAAAANYTLGYVNGTLLITKATPVLAWTTPDAITYGTALSGAQLNATASVAGTFTYTPAAGTVLDAGNHPLNATFTPADATNYTGAAVATSLTVNRAPLTATADDKTKVYGASNPPLTISYSGFVNGETIASITPPTIATTAITTSAVGTYPIKLTGGSAANYTLTLVDGTLAVTKASLTVTASNQSRTYGVANPTLTYTITGFLNGDTAAVVSGAPAVTTPATTVSAVGSYPIVPTLGSLAAANYAFAPFVNGTLTITPAALTVTANDKTKVYGDANPAFDATITGFVNGETTSVVSGAAAFTTTATAASAAGTYPIVPSLGTLSAPNYTFASFNNGTLAVTKALLTVKADDKTRVYGTANPAFTFAYSGFVNGDTAAAVSTAPTLSTSATAGSSVGSYAIVPSGAAAANYTFAYINGTLSITKATPVLAWTTTDAITYGTALSGAQLNATANVAGTFTYTPAAGTVLDAGNHALSATFTPADTTNYTAAATATSLVVNRAPLTATADDKTKVYGSPNPPLTITYTGFVNGDTIAAIVPPTITTPATASSAVGTYPINLTGGSAANYTLTLVDGTLAVTAANVGFTFSPTQFTYNALPQAPAITPSDPATTFSVTYQSADGTPAWAQYGPSADAPTNAATYIVTATATGNYNGSANAQFVIAPKPVTWTWAPTTFVYDTQPHVPALTGSDPAATFDLLDVTAVTDAGTPQQQVTATTISSIAPQTSAGSYLNGVVATRNYINDPAPLGGAAVALLPWSISQKPVTFTFSNLNQTYDTTVKSATVACSDPNATFTATLQGGPDIGSYPVAATATGNYSGTGSDTLVIAPKPITFSFGNLAQVYDGAVKAATVIPNDPNATFIANLTGGPNIGTYPVNATATGNYTGTGSATLTIAPKPVTFALSNLSQVYDAQPKTITVVPTDPATTFTVTYDGGSSAPTNVGSYSVAVSATGNFSGSATGTLIISPKPVTFTFSNLAYTYDGTTKTATVTPSDPNATFTADATGGPNAGTYTVTATATGNFVGSGSATLTIDRKPVTFTFGNLAHVYDGTVKTATVVASDSNATFTASLSGGPDAGSYGVSAMATGNYTGSGSDTLTIARATATFSFAPTSFVYDGTAKSPAITADPAIATFAISGTPTATAAGSYSVTATATGNYIGSNTAAWTIAKATPVITWNAPAPITYGTALSGTQLNGSANVPGTFVYTPAAGTVLHAGAGQTLTVAFTPTDTANYTAATASTRLTVNKATLTVTADDKTRQFSDPNPPFTVSYSGFVNGDIPASLSAQPTAACAATATTPIGTYPIVASGGGSNDYTFVYVNGVLTIERKPVSFTFSNLSQVYNGTPRAATVTPSDPATTFNVTYDGNTTAPTNAGNYTVVATATGNYIGSGTATLTIARKPVTFTFSNLSPVYDANPHAATVVADDPAATFGVTYDGSTPPPTNAGSYNVVATTTGNFIGSGTATLTIGRKPVTFSFSALSQMFDGLVKTAAVTVSDPATTFTSSLQGGPAVGSYPVSATATGNFIGSGSDTLRITPAPLTVTLTGPVPGTYAPINQGVTFSGNFTLTGVTGPYTVTWVFTPASGTPITVTGTYTNSSLTVANIANTIPFATGGVYNVTLIVQDSSGTASPASAINGQPAFVVIYDPNAKSINGGGWMDVPPGSTAALTTAARANFGINVQYNNNAPQGKISIDVKDANFSFDATSILWIVSDYPYGEVQGTGTVNGGGSYSYVLKVIDGNGGTGRLRLIVWDPRVPNDPPLFDNQIGDPRTAPVSAASTIDGGNISVH